MHPHFDRLHSLLAGALRDLSPEKLTRHPEGKWSPAQILEHLNLSYTGTIKGFERCLQAGATTAGPDRRRLPRFLVINVGYFPPGRKSPERAMPRGAPPEKITAEILGNVVRLDDLTRECETRFGRKPVVDHPVLGPLTAAEWRKFHLVHGKHHAKQIHKLKTNA